MDLLAGISRDQLHIFAWIVPAAFALAAGLWRPRQFHWAALGAVLLFAALNAGAGVYVLNHFADSRWASGSEPPLNAPSFSGTPLIGQYLKPLDSALNNLVGGVNEFLAFKQALPTAMDFLAASGWALLLAFPIAVLAAIINFAAAKRRSADFARYSATVEELKEELDQIKRQISPRNSPDPALPTQKEPTDFDHR